MKSFNKYFTEYEKIKNFLKWRLNPEIIKLIALIYYIFDSEFDEFRFKETVKLIKENSKLFVHYKGYLIYQLAAMLCSKYENSSEKFDELKRIDMEFNKLRFENSSYLSIVSFFLIEMADKDDIISKSSEIYLTMKNKNFFISSEDDYPLAVLLSVTEKNEIELFEDIESYYKSLMKRKFKKGKELQFLSQLLGVFEIDQKGLYMDKCRTLFEFLKSSNMSKEKMIYPVIGLAVINDEDLDSYFKKTMNTYEIIKNTKGFKFGKTINTVLAFVLNFDFNEKDKLKPKIKLNLDEIMKAQLVTLIALYSASLNCA
ncbi:DUF4003 domain-containing protein [Oceanotoga sp. DSM 15011]|nr:DUF4003 domain-containing protein [Oceanotoga sp. DSM 15011]UYO99421.1 DUF4003 domain-containing protein [Oceanotoga sp. DSM 15011]